MSVKIISIALSLPCRKLLPALAGASDGSSTWLSSFLKSLRYRLALGSVSSDSDPGATVAAWNVMIYTARSDKGYTSMVRVGTCSISIINGHCVLKSCNACNVLFLFSSYLLHGKMHQFIILSLFGFVSPFGCNYRTQTLMSIFRTCCYLFDRLGGDGHFFRWWGKRQAVS